MSFKNLSKQVKNQLIRGPNMMLSRCSRSQVIFVFNFLFCQLSVLSKIVSADYNDADKILQKIIDDNTTSDTGEATKPLNVKLPDVDEDGAITDEALGESIQGVTRDKRKVEGYLRCVF